jgi:L-threonylcarbamoyladenylate synthase
MLKSHYAPRIPLSAHNRETLCAMPGETDAAYLFFDGASRDAWLGSQPPGHKGAVIAVLSETGNMLEAAAQLFETLHHLDRPDVQQIHAQLVPETGLGAAINDRLRRAST